MAVKNSSFVGWEKNLNIFNDSVEVILPWRWGPRIISYRSLDGRSVFKLVEEEAGKLNEKGWRILAGIGYGLLRRTSAKKTDSLTRPTIHEWNTRIDDECTARVSHVIENPAKIRRDCCQFGKDWSKRHGRAPITNQSGASLELTPLGDFGGHPALMR